MASPSSARRRSEVIGRYIRGHLADVFGVGWIVLVGILLLSPALKDGHNFGPTDLGTTNSTLTQGSVSMQPACLAVPDVKPATGCAHNSDNGDIIEQGVPWNSTNWELVHHGELPLWNPQAGTGEPQLLNFESAALALPTLFGYLVPLGWSFLVTVLIKLLIAGLGTYWCCRVLGARPSAATLGGVSFMTSGALAGWLGWSISGPLVWTGALVASSVLVYRTRDRIFPHFLLSLSVAFTIFGGFPEDYALMAAALAAFGVAIVVADLILGASLSLRGMVRLVAAIAGGLGIASVLWLPGLSVLRSSVRAGEVGATGLPLHYAALFFAPGYDGLTIAGSAFFGSLKDQGLYFETSSSVAIVTTVLACLALVVSRRRRAVVGLAAMAIAAALLSFRLGGISPVQRFIANIGGGSIVLSRSLALLGFAVSVLGALGLEILCAQRAERSVRRVLDGAIAIVGVVLVALVVKAFRPGLSDAFAHLRRESLWWPVGSIGFMMLVGCVIQLGDARWDRLLRASRVAMRFVPVALVGVASAAGLFAEVGINSYAHTAYPKTKETEQLTSVVGSALLGLNAGNSTVSAKYPLGLRQWEGIGFYPNMNTPYGIDELGLHDPVVSSTYFAAWPVAGADPSGGGLNLFVPNVDTVALARKYGVEYVLSFPGYSPPKGMSPVAKIGHEVLSRVPDSGRFTIGTSLAPLRFTQPNDTTYTVDTVGRSGSLVARITNSPGWQASVDGKDLPISAVGGAAGESGVFLQVTVPPGSRSVTFHYQPPHALIADALLLLTLLAYAGAGAVSFGQHARRRSSGVSSQTAGRTLPSREAQRLPSTIPRAPG